MLGQWCESLNGWLSDSFFSHSFIQESLSEKNWCRIEGHILELKHCHCFNIYLFFKILHFFFLKGKKKSANILSYPCTKIVSRCVCLSWHIYVKGHGFWKQRALFDMTHAIFKARVMQQLHLVQQCSSYDFVCRFSLNSSTGAPAFFFIHVYSIDTCPHTRDKAIVI